MGSPMEFKELKLPACVIYALQVAAFLRDILTTLCPYISFLVHANRQPIRTQQSSSTSDGACRDALPSSIADEIVPMIRFSDLRPDPEDCCTVCLMEFGSDDEIRRLRNCRHVFHRGCLDRWMVDHQKMTCPVCRDRFVPVELLEDFTHWVSSSGQGLYGLYRWWF